MVKFKIRSYEYVVQSHYDTCHISLKYMRMIKKSDHMRSTYLKPPINQSCNHLKHMCLSNTKTLSFDVIARYMSQPDST